MADPKVNFVQKGANVKASEEVVKTKIKFKFSLPIAITIFSTLFFFGIGAMCVNFIWGYQTRQLEAIKEKTEAKKKEFEPKDLEYAIAPMEINFPAKDEGLKHLHIAITFQLQSEYAKREFGTKEDQIRDDILTLLSGKKEEELRDIPSRKKIQEEITMRVNKFLSKKAQVKDVYFPEFLIDN
jgi:flagellar basal body-associated protein FliL